MELLSILWQYEGLLFKKPNTVYGFIEALKKPLRLIEDNNLQYQLKESTSKIENYFYQLDIKYTKKPKSIEEETRQFLANCISKVY